MLGIVIKVYGLSGRSHNELTVLRQKIKRVVTEHPEDRLAEERIHVYFVNESGSDDNQPIHIEIVHLLSGRLSERANEIAQRLRMKVARAVHENYPKRNVISYDLSVDRLPFASSDLVTTACDDSKMN